MIAFEIIVLLGGVFFLGYFVGRTGKADADKARQDVENAAIAFGHAEIKVEGGKRSFRWKPKA
jgi:hypothetical protein